MRYAYGALVLSSLLWQRDLQGNGPLPSGAPGGGGAGGDGPQEPCRERPLLRQLQSAFCAHRGLCWLATSPWGFHVVGTAVLVLWLAMESGASSSLAALPGRLWRAAARPPQAAAGAEGEAGFQAAPANQCLCVCGTETLPALDSDDQSCERCRCASQVHEDRGNRHQGEILYPERIRDAPLLSSIILWHSSSSSPTSSSPPTLPVSSSSSSSSAPYLTHSDSPSSSRIPATAARDSSPAAAAPPAEPASNICASSAESDDRSLLSEKCQSPRPPPERARRRPPRALPAKGKRKPSYLPLIKRKRKPRAPSMNDQPKPTGGPLEEGPGPPFIVWLPESGTEVDSPSPSPPGDSPQPLAPIRQINICQRSAYEKEDGIVLVEKSLEIRMGPASPAEQDAPSPPTPMLLGPGERKEAAARLPVRGKTDPRRIDRNLQGKLCLAGARETSSRDASSRAALHPGLQTIPRPPSPPCNVESTPCILNKMDDGVRNLLEFHAKKKMVQRRCGLPTLVRTSVRRFQSLENQLHGPPVCGSERPVGSRAPVPAAGATRRHPSPRSTAKEPRGSPVREPPRRTHFAILRPAEPKESRRPPFLLVQKLGARKAARRGTGEPSILLSMEPDELRRLLFHIAVKMLEIKRGAFPGVVEDSLRVAGLASAYPLPKLLRVGLKVPRPKHPLLSFVSGEALCIIDLNVRHKHLVHMWKLPTLYMRSVAEMTFRQSQAGRGEPPRSTGKGLLRPPCSPRPAGSPKAEKIHFQGVPGEVPASEGPPGPKAAPQEPQLQRHISMSRVGDVEMQPEEGFSGGVLPRPPDVEGAAADADGKGEGKEGSVCRALLPLSLTKEAAADRGAKEKGEAAQAEPEPEETLCPPSPPPPAEKGAGADGSADGRMRLHPAEPERMVRYAILPVSTKTGATTDGVAVGRTSPGQADLGGKVRYLILPSSAKRQAGPDGSAERTRPGQAAPETKVRYAMLLPSTKEGAEADGGAERGASPGQADLDGKVRYLILPSSAKKQARPDGSAERTRPGQADLDGKVPLLPSAEANGAEADGGAERGASPGQAQLEGKVSHPVLPPSKEGAEADGGLDGGASPGQAEPERKVHHIILVPPAKEGARANETVKPVEAGLWQEALGGLGRMFLPPPAEKRAEADRGKAVSEQARIWQKESSITRTSLFVELDLAKKKLNVLLKKRLEAKSQRPEAVQHELGAEPEPEARREGQQPARRQARPGRPPRARPARPFCYVCMPLDEAGAAVKTVCWALPQWIMEMNGHRVPQVVRRARRGD